MHLAIGALSGVASVAASKQVEAAPYIIIFVANATVAATLPYLLLSFTPIGALGMIEVAVMIAISEALVIAIVNQSVRSLGDIYAN